jgi:hypothetical protein
MKFYKVSYPRKSPHQGASYPCGVLVRDGWNDFGYHTLWAVYLYASEDHLIYQGGIKILQKNPDAESEALHSTHLPDEFQELDDLYCSLGSDLKYYETLKAAGTEIYIPYLRGLRDVAVDSAIRDNFYHLEGFHKSLLRFSEAEKAFREAGSLFDLDVVNRAFVFNFSCRVPGATNPHDVSFDFSPHPTGLHRNLVLIGKNGTGKTQFLAQFARAMSGWRSESDPEYGFTPERPSFSRVIAVSYSVFDDFARPPEGSRTFSYKYCGIREPNAEESGASEGQVPSMSPRSGARFLSPERLQQKLVSARQLIRDSDREGHWKDILKILLEGTVDPPEEAFEDLSFYDQLSSGQRILVAIMTEIIAHIAEQSIILFDEPELHLHPEVFVALARAFDRLLDDFDSYAIIATHSALLLQETLSRQVRVFRRRGNSPIVSPLTVESFGENLTAITSQVFAVDGAQNNFRAHLDKLMIGRTVDQVQALFPLGLPLQAKAYLEVSESQNES